MIEYRYINKAPESSTNLLHIIKMWKDNWLYQTELDWILIFYKKVTKKIDKKDKEATPYFLAFIKKYRTITNKSSYDNKLIWKYEDALKVLSHKEHMEKLDEYIWFLKVNPNRPPVQVGAWLNQSRYLEPYETVKVNFNTKWRDTILKEQNISWDLAEVIMLEAEKWDATYKDKEMTVNIFNNIIEKYAINNWSR